MGTYKPLPPPVFYSNVGTKEHKLFSTLVYVDMGLSTNSPIVLTVVTAGPSFARSFSIKVSQIECDSLAKGKTLSQVKETKLRVS